MIIRKAQLTQIASVLEESFVRRMVQHITDDLLPHYEAQGLKREDIRNVVQSLITTARTYGLVNTRDLKLYIDCAVAFGQSFNTDPRLPWASAALSRKDLDGSAKADILHEYLTFAR